MTIIIITDTIVDAIIPINKSVTLLKGSGFCARYGD